MGCAFSRSRQLRPQSSSSTGAERQASRATRLTVLRRTAARTRRLGTLIWRQSRASDAEGVTGAPGWAARDDLSPGRAGEVDAPPDGRGKTPVSSKKCPETRTGGGPDRPRGPFRACGVPGRASCGCRARGWPALRKCHDRPSTPSQKGPGPGLISNERREESDGQALAALGTAGAQHGTTTPAFLANQEAMSSFTTADGGLIGALHDGYQKSRGGSRACEGRRRFSRNLLLDRQNEGFVNDFCDPGRRDPRWRADSEGARRRHAVRAGGAGTGTIGVLGQACG